MKTTQYTVTDIERIVNDCAVHDALARRSIRSADYHVIITADGVITSRNRSSEGRDGHNNRCLLIQAWPGGDAVTMVSYRLLGADQASLRSNPSHYEFAVDWSAEAGVSSSEPIILHVVHGDADTPVFFDYTVSHHLGRKRDHFSLDMTDIQDRFHQVVERLCEHVMLVAQFHAKIDQAIEVAA